MQLKFSSIDKDKFDNLNSSRRNPKSKRNKRRVVVQDSRDLGNLGVMG